MKKVLIIGLGVSGRSAARFLLAQGRKIVAIDQKSSELEKEPEIQLLKKSGLILLEERELLWNEYDLVILSPGIPRDHPWVIEASRQKLEIIDELELGSRSFKGRAIGITGTNGKTTVTLLSEHVLNACGKKAKALGNIGTPFTTYLLNPDPDAIVVLEVSSYQLETMTHPIFDAAVILNITPDHLDRYPSMDAYAAAKWRIAECVKEEKKLFVYEKTPFLKSNTVIFGTSPHLEAYTDREHAFFQGKLAYHLPQSYTQLGLHESINALSAYLLCQTFGVTGKEFSEAVATFKKPSHRIEFVKEIAGVFYFDDSKGTNIDATIQAVNAMQGDVILIAGGMDKMSGYQLWKDALKTKVRNIIALGQAAEKIKNDLKNDYEVVIVKSLQEAVEVAATQARPGDSVLLSPGCSSYDMFKGYAHRGQEFQRLVHSLSLKY